MQQWKSGFKRTITGKLESKNWNKYQSKVTIQPQDPYLDYVTNTNFQEVNRHFILSFESNNDDRTVHTGYFIPKVEIKDYNVMNAGQNFLDQPVKSDMKHRITFRKSQLVKEMITQQVVY